MRYGHVLLLEPSVKMTTANRPVFVAPACEGDVGAHPPHLLAPSAPAVPADRLGDGARRAGGRLAARETPLRVARAALPPRRQHRLRRAGSPLGPRQPARRNREKPVPARPP